MSPAVLVCRVCRVAGRVCPVCWAVSSAVPAAASRVCERGDARDLGLMMCMVQVLLRRARLAACRLPRPAPAAGAPVRATEPVGAW